MGFLQCQRSFILSIKKSATEFSLCVFIGNIQYGIAVPLHSDNGDGFLRINAEYAVSG